MMEARRVCVMDDADYEIVDILGGIGLNRAESRALVYLMRMKSSTSRDIVIGSGLPQPAVSVAMQNLSARGWISRRELQTNGRGRAHFEYSLEVSPNEILSQLEYAETQRHKEVIQKIASAKKLIGGQK
jgi:predicted transcriptional regulator